MKKWNEAEMKKRLILKMGKCPNCGRIKWCRCRLSEMAMAAAADQIDKENKLNEKKGC